MKSQAERTEERLLIDYSFFCARTAKCLRDSGIRTLYQLQQTPKSLLMQISRFGPYSLNEVNAYLKEWDF